MIRFTSFGMVQHIGGRDTTLLTDFIVLNIQMLTDEWSRFRCIVVIRRTWALNVSMFLVSAFIVPFLSHVEIDVSFSRNGLI